VESSDAAEAALPTPPQMITEVVQQYIILAGPPGSGFRVNRHPGASVSMVVKKDKFHPSGSSWTSTHAQDPLPYNGNTYAFAFWSWTAYDSVKKERAAGVPPGDVCEFPWHSNGMWTVTAKAFYVWDLDAGPGENKVLIDAFDIAAGEPFGDDFVDVDPQALTAVANDMGEIDTETQIAPKAKATIIARDPLIGKSDPPFKSRTSLHFSHWQAVRSLVFNNDPTEPVTVGQLGAPDAQEIVAHHNDRVVAFAFYEESGHPILEHRERLHWPHEWIYDPWAWIMTHHGLGPDPPPWWPQLAAATVLASAASQFSPALRSEALQLAARQLSIAAEAMRGEIARLDDE
jgi:hypothetical protein